MLGLWDELASCKTSNEACMRSHHSKCNSSLAFVKLGTGSILSAGHKDPSDPLHLCRTFGELMPVDSYSCDTSKHDDFVVSRCFEMFLPTGSWVPCCQIRTKKHCDWIILLWIHHSRGAAGGTFLSTR